MDKDTAIKILSKKGLSREVVEAISVYKDEPEWMRENRLKAFDHYTLRPIPKWGADLSGFKDEEIRFYVTPGSKKNRTWDEVPEEMKKTFDDLKVPEAERKFLAGVETQFDSNVIYGRLKEQWESQGVIFTDTDTGLREYPELFKKWFGKAIPLTDNKYAALNTACWSGGSFVYVPKGVKVKVPLQAYFYIQTQNLGQFERTLIIADEGAEVHYVEGCHRKGSKVHTSVGLKNIEDIKINDLVLTHAGSFKRVLNTASHIYNGKLYEISLWGDSSKKLYVTEDHPFLAVSRKYKKAKNKSFDHEWLTAGSLKNLDYLVYPIKRSAPDINNFKLKIRLREKNLNVIKNVRLPVENKDFFRLVGYFLAEGHVDNEHYLTFTFNKDERDLVDDVKNIIKELYDKDCTENKPRLNGQTIVLCSTLVARTFAKVFGSNITEKHIPESFFSMDNAKLMELVKGMWLGDGSYSSKANQFRFSSISESLAYSFRDILARLGIQSTINRNKRVAPRRDLFQVIISRPFNNKFGKIVNIESENGRSAGSMCSIDNEFIYMPIKSIKLIDTNEEVFNLSVEEDQTYVCDGVVSHNCSAPTYSSDILHSGVIELIALKDAKIRYTTIQNWSKNVYNLVTQRGLAYENATIEWVDCNMGSKVTMKYPSVVMVGNNAHGEVLSIAMADKGQHLDSGAKMIHIGKNTSGIIKTKSICQNGGRTSYRGLVKVTKGAKNSKIKVVCDALILDDISQTDTYPYNEIYEKQSKVEHEASVSKVSESQLYYLMSKGLSEEEASGLIVAGFVDPITKELPMEYALEMNQLINMSMKGSVG